MRAQKSQRTSSSCHLDGIKCVSYFELFIKNLLEETAETKFQLFCKSHKEEIMYAHQIKTVLASLQNNVELALVKDTTQTAANHDQETDLVLELKLEQIRRIDAYCDCV